MCLGFPDDYNSCLYHLDSVPLVRSIDQLSIKAANKSERGGVCEILSRLPTSLRDGTGYDDGKGRTVLDVRAQVYSTAAITIRQDSVVTVKDTGTTMAVWKKKTR